MILIVPRWLEEKVTYEMIAYCWLYVIIQSDGRGFVYKDRYGPQRFVESEEIAELVSFYQNDELYKTLTNVSKKP